MHKGPDAISRHPEGRDQLILAKANEWAKHRSVIKGLTDAIEAGEFDDEEPVMVAPADLPPEQLEPLSYEALLEAGAIGPGAETQIQGIRRKKAEARDDGAPPGAAEPYDGSPFLEPCRVDRTGEATSAAVDGRCA